MSLDLFGADTIDPTAAARARQEEAQALFKKLDTTPTTAAPTTDSAVKVGDRVVDPAGVEGDVQALQPIPGIGNFAIFKSDDGTAVSEAVALLKVIPKRNWLTKKSITKKVPNWGVLAGGAALATGVGLLVRKFL